MSRDTASRAPCGVSAGRGGTCCHLDEHEPQASQRCSHETPRPRASASQGLPAAIAAALQGRTKEAPLFDPTVWPEEVVALGQHASVGAAAEHAVGDVLPASRGRLKGPDFARSGRPHAPRQTHDIARHEDRGHAPRRDFAHKSIARERLPQRRSRPVGWRLVCGSRHGRACVSTCPAAMSSRRERAASDLGNWNRRAFTAVATRAARLRSVARSPASGGAV